MSGPNEPRIPAPLGQGVVKTAMLVVVWLLRQVDRAQQDSCKTLQSANGFARSNLGFKDKLVNITIQCRLPKDSQGILKE
jgi:hypothetical protein